jgi:hypothetical protein
LGYFFDIFKTNYKGKSFEGTFTMKMGSGAGGMTIKTVTTGKRIGECDK